MPDPENDAPRQRAVAELMAAAQPVIETVLARARSTTLRDADIDDIAGAIRLRLLRHLLRRQCLDEEPIEHFPDYVARLAQNTIHDHLRQRFPERTRLKNRLRYVLMHDERLASWTAASSRTNCGLRAWKGAEPLSRGSVELPAVTKAMANADAPGDAMVEIFGAVGAPLALDDLVRIVAGLWNVSDVRLEAETEVEGGGGPDERFETREYLSLLWREIGELQPRQRVALLLNLRDSDGTNAAALFVLLGIAGFDAVAATLGMSAERLAELWSDLPLDDRTIASLLGVTRQQVINLRKSARERLARRMRKP